MIENLPLNAVKYGDPDGPIACHIRWLGSVEVQLSVTNHGPAIPADEREAIFQPFKRGNETAGRESAGWGGGLAYAKAVSIGHGGDISVASSGPAGTTFEMRVPVDARPAFARMI